MLQDQKEEVEESLHKSESDRNELSVKVMDLEPRVDQLTSITQNLTKNLKQSEDKNVQLTETIVRLTSHRSALEKDVKDKQEAEGSAKSRLEEVENERDTFRTQRDNAFRNLAIRNEEMANQVCVCMCILCARPIPLFNISPQNERLIQKHNSEILRLKAELSKANGERMEYRAAVRN